MCKQSQIRSHFSSSLRTKLSVSTGVKLRISLFARSNYFRLQTFAAADRITLLGSNCVNWVVVDLAAQILQAITVPINPKLSESQQSAIQEHCQPKLELAVAPGDLQNLNATARSTSRQIQRLAELAEQIDSQQTATIIYTSGTTGLIAGRPKGVMLSHQNFATNVAALLSVSPVDENEQRLCILPLSHVFARTNDLYACIAGGCTLAPIDSPSKLFAAFKLIRPTFLNAVPYLLEMISAEQLATLDENDDLSTLLGGRIKAINCGGAAIEPEIEHQFAKQGIPLITGYGLTETSPVISASAIGHHQIGCVGQPLPGVDMRIADDGEILVRGPNVMQGYYRDDAATANVIRNGWLHTGDIGRMLHGSLKIEGRKTDMIVTSTGYNVFPESIEKRIGEIEDVVCCCVIGNGSRCLAALICLHDKIATEHLRTNLLAKIKSSLVDLAGYQQVANIAIIDEPFTIDNGLLTPKGNLRREAIADLYAEQISQLDLPVRNLQRGSDRENAHN